LALLNQEWRAARSEGLVETFVVGGETLLAEQVQIWRDLNYPPRIVNEYGPTETVVGCCVYEVQPDDPVHGPVPIGWPIANTQMYIVSPDMELLPIGELGEIYIGGAGVARGYLNRPELTAERFLADPFSAEPGARLYKTGDLGRRRSDGAIECFGRLDDQVKIRGYRVELGEIEAMLFAQSGVRACAVVATESAFGSKQLVAHVVPQDLSDLRTDQLRLALAKFLPDHMIPARFVISNPLPLTANGKVDKSALRFAAMDRISHGSEMPMMSETERTIAAIWRNVLNISSVGVHDDFFEVGGDSLNAIQVMSEINEVFNIDLKLETLFEWATIFKLAKAVNAMRLSLQPMSADKAAHQEEFEV